MVAVHVALEQPDEQLSSKLKKQSDLNLEIASILKKVHSVNKPSSNTLLADANDSSIRISSENGNNLGYTLNMNSSLPLADKLAHRLVDETNLWVAVHEGTVAVLDNTEHDAMLLLKAGKSIKSVINEQPANKDSILKLVGKLATAGFIKGIEGYRERIKVLPHRFARFHLTQFCQLECIHCYADSSPHIDRSRDKPTEWWQKLITNFASYGGERILFTGGEALTHKGCIDLIQHSKDLNLFVTLFSNGLMMKRAAPKLKGLCDEVQISLDGPDVETNDPIRGKGSYKRIISAIETLLAQGGTRVRVGMCVMEENWDSWQEKFLNFAEKFANTGLEFKLSYGLIPHGRGAGKNDRLGAKDTQTKVEELLKDLPGPSNSNGPRVTRAKSSCGYAEQLVVGPDGTVYPCHLLDAALCNVDDKPYEEIIKILERFTTLFEVDHIEGCKYCDIRYLCGGTCRVVNGTQNGSRFINTCNPAEKYRKMQNLVRYYA